MKRTYKLYLFTPVLCFFLAQFSLAQDVGFESVGDTGPSNSFLVSGGMSSSIQGKNTLISVIHFWPLNSRFSLGMGAGYERFRDNNHLPVFLSWRTNLGGVFESQIRPFVSIGGGLALNIRSADQSDQPVNRNIFTGFLGPSSSPDKPEQNHRISGSFHAGLGVSRTIGRDLSVQLSIIGRLRRLAYKRFANRSDYPDLVLPVGTTSVPSSFRLEEWERSLNFTLGLEFM